MFIVALTGGLGTGKSTVLEIFKNKGVAVIDADEVARLVVEPGKKAWKEIKEYFGDQVLLKNGRVDRAKLGAIVFADSDKRRQLNRITHPQIQKMMIQMSLKYFFFGHRYVVMELPLLFESGMMIRFMHRIITVTCDPSIQVIRLCKRNSFTTFHAKQRIHCQMKQEEKASRSHYVINNSLTMDVTLKQAEAVKKELDASPFPLYIRGFIFSVILLVFLFIYVHL